MYPKNGHRRPTSLHVVGKNELAKTKSSVAIADSVGLGRLTHCCGAYALSFSGWGLVEHSGLSDAKLSRSLLSFAESRWKILSSVA